MTKIKPNKAPSPNQPSKKSKTSFFQKTEDWLAKKQKQILVSMVSIAVVFRIVYFIQLNSGPCIWQHRYVESDMNFYDQWAKDIAHGDWLTDRSFHQYTATYQWIAEYYLKTHPADSIALQKKLGSDKSPDALGKLVWKKWDGGKIFHQDPLYIYLVAIVYKVFGEDVRYVFILQMVIGIFSVLLIYFITRKHFGNIAAVVSGFTATFCGPLMFYELVLLRESCIVFAGLLLVYLMDKIFEKKSGKQFFIFGIILALCILLKSTFVIFLFLTLLLSFFIFRKEIKSFTLFSTMLLTGVLIGYSPLLIRNAIVKVPLFTQNSIGSVSVIASNDVYYNPSESFAINLKNITEILEKTEGKTLPSLLEAISTHPDIWSYLLLLLKKFALIFHWYEFPNNKNFYYYRIHAPVLWFSCINLIFIAPLALAGIVISLIQRKKPWSLYLLLSMHLFLLVLFLVLSRYRIPLVAAMIPFAGFAFSEIIKSYKENIKYTFAILLGVVLVAFYVGRALPENITLIRGMDFQQPYNFYYQKILDEKLAKGDRYGALMTMRKFMSYEPDDVKKMHLNGIKINQYQLVLARVYADFHTIYGRLYEVAGDQASSKMEMERAQELQNIVSMNGN